MVNTLNFARKALRGGTALQALALMGAGVGMIAAAAPAAAQDYTQVNATGRVQGTNGQPIAGATVTVTSNDQGFARTATTGTDGSFRIPSLPQGSYTFTIEASGYDGFTDNAVTLTQAGSANQFTLSPAGSAESGDIVVRAGRVQVADFDRTTTGAVINVGELATRVPVARDITSVALLSPGTSAGDSRFGNLPSIGGASVSENTYYVNGLNITNFRNGLGAVPVPFDFYQTVEVKNGGFGAEFGRTTGGFINATTKSGSNDFHGGVTFNWEPNDLASHAPNTYASDNDSTFASRKEFIAQLSGPIIKDHLFFYGLYQSRDVQTAGGSTGAVALTTPSTANTPAGQLSRNNSCLNYPQYCSLTYPGPTGAAGSAANPVNFGLVGTGYSATRNRSPFYGGKLDAVIVDGQRLELTYFNTSSLSVTDSFGSSLYTLASGNRYNPNTNNPGGYVGTVLSRAGGENWVGRYTGTFTNWLTVSGAYGRNNNRGTTESTLPNYPSITDARSGVSLGIGNPTSNTTTNFDRREFYRGDVDVYFKLLGTHHMRGGYDREDLSVNSRTIANGLYQITYLNSGTAATGDGTVLSPNIDYVTRRYFGNGGQFKTMGEAYYLQDSWSLFGNRLTLNLGVRNDSFVNRNGEGEVFFNSKNNWGPRLGFTFDPIGDGRTKVFGSFNRYYLPVATNTNLRLAGAELDYTQYYVLNGINADNTPIYGNPITVGARGLNPNLGENCPALAVSGAGVANCTVNNDGTTPPFLSLVDQNLQAQSADEYILGVEQRLGSRWRVSAVYSQRNLRQSLEDAYIDAGVRGYCRRQNAAGSLSTADLNSCLSTWRGNHQYALLNPGQDVTVALDGGPASLDGKFALLTAADLGLPQAKRDYKAMTFTVDREWDGKWSLSANYTLSSLVGNIEGGVRSDNGQSDSGLTTAFDYPALVNGAYGYLPQHRRHNLKIYGSYQLLDILTFGANLQVQSPRKFGCIGRVPNYVDGGSAGVYGAAGYYCNVDSAGNILINPITNPVSNPSFAAGTTFPQAPAGTLRLTPRGSRLESDWLAQLNVDVALRVPTDAFDGFLRFSVFNVLNTHDVLRLQEVGTATNGTPSPNYGLPLDYSQPRYVRIQFGVNF